MYMFLFMVLFKKKKKKKKFKCALEQWVDEYYEEMLRSNLISKSKGKPQPKFLELRNYSLF